MRALLTAVVIGSFLISACNGTDDQKAITANDLQKTMVRNFSDSLRADTFKVHIEGDKPTEMRLVFTIKNAESKEIYHTVIKAAELFKNYNATIDLKKKKNQIKFLKEEMGRFFEEENLMEPAVTESEKPDQHVPDQAFFEELKQNQLNGFIYHLGRENKIYIAWSTSRQQVKPYYICCK